MLPANDKSFWLKNHRVCCTYNMYGRSDGRARGAPARPRAARGPRIYLIGNYKSDISIYSLDGFDNKTR